MHGVGGVDAEQVEQRGVQVDRGGERVARPGVAAGPRDEQRDVAERLVDRHPRLAPDVLLAEVVTVVGAEDHRRVVPQSVAVDGVEHATEPVVDHRQLGAVTGAHLPGLALVEHALLDPAVHVRRPDQVGLVPVVVVHRRVGLGRVERLVRIELVDEQQEAVVRAGVVVEPPGRRGHRARSRESRPRRGTSRASCRRACDRAGSCGAPIQLGSARVFQGSLSWPAQVVPAREVAVVVLAAGLEQVRDGR